MLQFTLWTRRKLSFTVYVKMCISVYIEGCFVSLSVYNESPFAVELSYVADAKNVKASHNVQIYMWPGELC